MDTTTYYIKFIASSFLIIGTLLIFLRYSKKIQKTHLNKQIKIIERMATSSQSHIMLIKVKDTEYLIGASNNGIKLIDKL
mgnify:CR=1 FL=1